MKDDELKAFLEMQNTLALIAYVDEHKLGINPLSFMKRKDEVACKIRHDAGMEWAASRADRFRTYWERNHDALRALSPEDESVCTALLRKF